MGIRILIGLTLLAFALVLGGAAFTPDEPAQAEVKPMKRYVGHTSQGDKISLFGGRPGRPARLSATLVPSCSFMTEPWPYEASAATVRWTGRRFTSIQRDETTFDDGWTEHLTITATGRIEANAIVGTLDADATYTHPNAAGQRPSTCTADDVAFRVPLS